MIKVLLAVYWLICFVLTHIPPWLLPEGEQKVNDKLIHAALYGVLSFLWALASRSSAVPAQRVYRKGFLVLSLYAVFDELSQIPVGREADILDLAADLAGIFLGFITYSIMSHGLIARIFSKGSKLR